MTKQSKLNVASVYTVAAMGEWEVTDPITFAVELHFKQIREISMVVVGATLSRAAIPPGDPREEELNAGTKLSSMFLWVLNTAAKRLAVQTNRDMSRYFEALKEDPIIGLALMIMVPVDPDELGEAEREAMRKAQPGTTFPTVESVTKDLMMRFRAEATEFS